MDEQDRETLTAKAQDIRITTIRSIGASGGGHIGGSMSIVEVLTILYYRYMQVDSQNPGKSDRDRLVVSKGHAGPTLYSILADLGFFSEDWLQTLNQGGTNLPSHCDKNRTPGIDMSTGSLGQGLSAAVGMALGLRLDQLSSRVFALIGDGESHEGQIWEAAMSASHFKLSNLIAFTDYNKLALDGCVDEVMSLNDITSKWVSFGWHTQRVDGHSFDQLERAIDKALAEPCRPSMIVLDTIKGKGCSFAEGKVESHKMSFTSKEAEKAVSQLTGKEGE
ncbi:MAG: transketolase [Spirochaetales bacterium]|nr:transketolase [Spirochaetales bacterium]MCF7937501.1 transketolase [Spirochaetales bacterium]